MPPTVLEKAVIDRGILQSSILWLEKKITTHKVKPLSVVEADHIMANLEDVLIDVKETHRRIMSVSSFTEEAEKHAIEYQEMLEQTYNHQLTLKEIKNTFHSSSPVLPNNRSSHVKLPRLELPTFNGNLNDWLSFHDMFMTAVHSNSQLSDAEKLTYPRSLLTEEAAQVVQSIPSTDANYTIAWKGLLDRYQNTRELFFSILKRFVSQPTLVGDSPNALRLLIDVSKECIRSLETLKVSVDTWDGILVFLMMSKLDSSSRQYWELTLKDTGIPVLKDFLDFLEQRARALAAGASCNPALKTKFSSKPSADVYSKKVATHHASESNDMCKICACDHHHYKCPKFSSMTIPERQETIRKLNLCYNCLRVGHSSAQCPSDKLCRTCNKKHHSMIHLDKSVSETNGFILTHHTKDVHQIAQTILATAIVNFSDCYGLQQPCRAFLDGGSTASFITEACLTRLGLKRNISSTEVTGLSDVPIATVRGKLDVTLRSRQSEFSTISHTLSVYVLPKVTGKLPCHTCNPKLWPHLNNIELADPYYHRRSEIDLLIGADLFYDILLSGKKLGFPGAPIGIRSKFGWLVAGSANPNYAKVQVYHAYINLNKRLEQFWAIESVPTTRTLTKEEKSCEKHFDDTHQRDGEGRFIVQLPIKSTIGDRQESVLGASRDIAIRRFKQLERRLSDNPAKRMEYIRFMREYTELGHMSLIPEIEVSQSVYPTAYIPHHGITKDSSTTTKFRVVFDASAKTSNGISLNKTLMVGPTLQDSLINILMRFRTHIVAFTADVTKMYRQIRVADSDTDKQRIVWREDPSQPIRDYRLLTVTYSTASAPYHAVKVLQQLAVEAKEDLPLGAAVALNDFYMDDVMSGGTTAQETLEIQTQLLQLTERGKFELRKWSSNRSALLEAVPESIRETQIPLQTDTDNVIKTLGLCWHPGLDEFSFKVQNYTTDSSVTKRSMLSAVAKLFDPLGWLAPVIVRAKILIQDLWRLNIGWDDQLLDSIKSEWTTYRSNLSSIQSIQIPRCIIPEIGTQVSLVGFCDASEKAYAAAVYLRCNLPSNRIVVFLIISKTRVAPVKQISLPPLELCGAVALSQLMDQLREAVKIPIVSIQAWTDSTVVLAWLKSNPLRWKTFVANRVTQIQELIPPEAWFHVSGTDNPADCASRGIDPSELSTHPLWWNGPKWLLDDSPTTMTSFENDIREVIQEERQVIVTGHG